MVSIDDVKKSQSCLAGLHTQIQELQECLSQSECAACTSLLNYIVKSAGGFEQIISVLESVLLSQDFDTKR